MLAAVDGWPRAVETYGLNFQHPARLIDLSKIAPDRLLPTLGIHTDVDLIAGGPPCQGFSIQRIGDDQDERNELVSWYGECVASARPRAFLMENVPGLLGSRGRAIFRRFLSIVEEEFDVASGILDAADYGVPQHRRRVFVLGVRRDLGVGATLPAPDERPRHRTVADAIDDLPVPSEGGDSGQDPMHRKARMSPLNLRRIMAVPPGGGMKDLPEELRAACHRNGADRIGHRYVYGRLDPDEPAATITARFDSFTRGRFGHPHQHRSITLREGARLQTFPDDFPFKGTQEEIAAQIGNAVPPLLARHVGTHVLSMLERAVPGPLQPSLFQAERDRA